MVLKVYHLLGDLVLPTLSVCCCRLQAPYVNTIGCVRPFTSVQVAPRIALGIMMVGIPQVGSDVSATNL